MDVLFTTVSMMTTTGFTSTDFNTWPTFLPYFLVILALLGGCSGSTSGGIKFVRYLLFRAQIKREVNKLIHPQVVHTVKLGGETLPESTVQSIWAFVSAFGVLFVILLLVLLATGLSLTTAFSALATCLSNTGSAIGTVYNSYETVSITGKWTLIAAMLLGRLEVFTVLVLFSREYWRQ